MSAYQEQLDARKIEEGKQEGINLKASQAVAALLGATVKPPGEMGYYNQFHLEDGAGNVIVFSFNVFKHKGRIVVSGRYEGSVSDCLKYHENSPSITISCSKTPEQIVADLQRRFLPEYLELAEKCRELKQSRDMYAANKEALLNSLVIPGKLERCNYGDNNALDLKGVVRGEVRYINPERMKCDLKLSDLPLSVLKQIMDLIN